MDDMIAERIRELLKEGTSRISAGTSSHDRWRGQVIAYLRHVLGPDEANEFAQLDQDRNASSAYGFELGHLEGLLTKTEMVGSPAEFGEGNKATPIAVVPNARKVFVVHGHDTAAKEHTARFLHRLGLEPIILHEQPSGGRTIIEKFEVASSEVAFAVVLLTADDLGTSAADRSNLKCRARQNVILELGYFMGRLGRNRVCALHREGVELPSDYQGIVYVNMDDAGAWKPRLAQELVQCKLPIKLDALLNG